MIVMRYYYDHRYCHYLLTSMIVITVIILSMFLNHSCIFRICSTIITVLLLVVYGISYYIVYTISCCVELCHIISYNIILIWLLLVVVVVVVVISILLLLLVVVRVVVAVLVVVVVVVLAELKSQIGLNRTFPDGSCASLICAKREETKIKHERWKHGKQVEVVVVGVGVGAGVGVVVVVVRSW